MDKDLNVSEEMLAIPGFPRYFVTASGKIYSRVRDGQPPRQLATRPNEDGYSYLVLRHSDGKIKTVSVHRAIALAFLPAPLPEQTEVRHKNGIPGDSRLDNLEWGTHAQNMADRGVHGRDPKGEKNGRSKIDARQAGEVRFLIGAKVTLTTIGRRYGLEATTVRDIGSRVLWPDAPDADPDACVELLRLIAEEGVAAKKAVEDAISALYASLPWDDLSGSDLAGKRAGRFTLTAYLRSDATHHWWSCDCECGTKDRPVRLNHMRTRHVKSCGCLARELTVLRNKALYASGSRK